jgi:hypothetical protein
MQRILSRWAIVSTSCPRRRPTTTTRRRSAELVTWVWHLWNLWPRRIWSRTTSVLWVCLRTTSSPLSKRRELIRTTGLVGSRLKLWNGPLILQLLLEGKIVLDFLRLGCLQFPAILFQRSFASQRNLTQRQQQRRLKMSYLMNAYSGFWFQTTNNSSGGTCQRKNQRPDVLFVHGNGI